MAEMEDKRVGGERKSRLLVGLTGGLAAGKSTVAQLLREEGCQVRDADRIVAELYQPGAPGTEKIAQLFGDEYLTAERSIDHRRLGDLIFRDQKARARLEAAVHPLVRQAFQEYAREHLGIVVLEATLLVEAGFSADFDTVLTVEAPFESRLQRAVERGLTEEDARSRLEAQGDGRTRREAAHIEITNNGSLEDLRVKVRALDFLQHPFDQ